MIEFKHNTFTFDGQNSADFGLWISGTGTYNAPERDITEIEIPGKNGTIIFDNGRYKNIDVIYPAFIPDMDVSKLAGLRGFLLSKSTDYYRLVDTYHTDEYRMARYRGSLQYDIKGLHQAAEMEIVFNCKPQRFLLSGEEPVEMTSGNALTNPTNFNAAPVVRVYGSGAVSFGTGTLTINESPYDYIDIDCDIMEAYNGIYSCNEYIQIQGANFPLLLPGQNIVTFTASRVIITPRWWRL